MTAEKDSAGKISAEQVKYVADLARLELSPEEQEEFTAQLNAILEYMDQLNELETSGVEPTSHVLPLRNVLREDVAGPSLTVEEVLANAPDQEQGHFKVPKIIE